MVGMKEVAREAGVSVGTVSNVLNRPHAVRDETRLRVQSAIGRLGFVRSETARQLRSGSSRVLALLVPDLRNPFFADVAAGVESAAGKAGLGAMVCNSAQDSRREAEYLDLLAEQRVHGVLVTAAGGLGRDLDALRSQDIPYVLVDQIDPGGDACSASVDDLEGGRVAVQHLLRAGHRSIVYIGVPFGLPQARERRAGANAALTEAGLSADALIEVGVERSDVAAGRDAGARLLGLPSGPTAVFCANDLLALGVLQALFAAGVHVPQDIALVGYDDIDFAAAVAIPLTSVRRPAFTLGRRAAEMLIEETGPGRADHLHRQVILQPELVVRQSSLYSG
jgi:LacI family transcriptional regulator